MSEGDEGKGQTLVKVKVLQEEGEEVKVEENRGKHLMQQFGGKRRRKTRTNVRNLRRT